MFWYRPRRAPALLVMLALLVLPVGVAVAQQHDGTSADQQAGCISFEETGHSVCGGFRRFWETYGGLPIFGYPLTDEFVQDGLTVQYFERARFEWHPGAWPERWDVLLGRLGAEALGSQLDRTEFMLDALRRVVEPYKDVEVAQQAGWALVEGLDYCFDNPGVGAMGVHYINVGLLDTSLDPLEPEALVYHHGPNGELILGAVEWIVPVDAWEAEGHDELPQVMGRHLHLNQALGVYVLHAWIFTENPVGIFEDWNPNVSCPSSG